MAQDISFADIVKRMGLPALQPFMPTSETTWSYRNWIDYFDRYVTSVNNALPVGSRLTDQDKILKLHFSLGAMGMERFATNPFANDTTTITYAEFKAAVRRTFDTPKNELRCIHEFRTRMQGPSETVLEYLSTLRDLAKECNFPVGGVERELAIQLSLGCYHKETQEKLLAQEHIDYTFFFNMMQAEETARASTAVIRHNKTTIVAALKTTKYNKTHKQPHKGNIVYNSGNTATQRRRCLGCGNDKHKYKDKSCPALNIKCNECQKMGHFASQCIQAHPEKAPPSSNKRNYQQNIIQLCSVNSTIAYNITMQISTSNTGHINIIAAVDTGADITAVTNTQYQQYFYKETLTPATHTMKTYTGKPINDIHGYFMGDVHFEGRSIKTRIYVMPDSCQPVVGKDLIAGLNLHINGGTYNVSTLRQIRETTFYDQLLAEYPNLTAKDSGEFPDFEHVITLTSEAKPSVAKLRHVPIAMNKAVEEEVQEMIKQDIWEPVDKSEWIHGMVVVPKPNNKIRITTDLSPLNQYVVPHQYPLPLIKRIFHTVKGAKMFSKIDLSKAYFSVRIAQASRPYTATITPLGLMQYKRLPMGLRDSAAVFQRAISQTLAGCKGAIAYIDDILVYGKTRSEHDANLRAVLFNLSNKNFRLNKDKCTFAQKSVPFLGHIISADNKITPDPKNLEALLTTPKPETVKDVQYFLGLVNYFGDFLPNLATASEPLRELTRKNARFEWTTACQTSFENLRKMATQKLSIFVFDPKAPTIVTVDASNVGIGALLSQQQNGREVPIAFASHTLSQTERNYATNEKEAYACLWACEHWEHFLYGIHFTLRTDHQSLTSLLRNPKNQRQSSKFLRWFERLCVFDYQIEYTPGSSNKVADALSRLVLNTTSADNTQNCTVATINLGYLSLELIREETKIDSELEPLMHFLVQQWPYKTAIDRNLSPYYAIRNDLTLKDGCLYRSNNRIVLPVSLRKRTLAKAHIGHPGIVRMKRKMRECYWWPKMDCEIELLVKFCHACQRSAKSTPPLYVPRQPTVVAVTPGTCYAIDICGPFFTAPTCKRFLVVLIDHYSGFPEVLATDNITSSKIIAWLEEVFSRFGNPEQLLTDNGPQFISQEFSDFTKSRDIEHLRTAVYNPQSNGKVEVFNRYLKQGLQAYTDSAIPWSRALSQLLSTFRATSPSAHVKSPAEMFLGRAIRLEHEVVHRQLKTYNNNYSMDDEVHDPMHDNDQRESHLLCRGPFNVGDKVMYRLPSVLKGQSPYSRPVKIITVLGNFTYRLENGSIWHARQLRRFYERSGDEEATDDVEPLRPPPVPNIATTLRRSGRTNRGVPPPRYGYRN